MFWLLYPENYVIADVKIAMYVTRPWRNSKRVRYIDSSLKNLTPTPKFASCNFENTQFRSIQFVFHICRRLNALFRFWVKKVIRKKKINFLDCLNAFWSHIEAIWEHLSFILINNTLLLKVDNTCTWLGAQYINSFPIRHCLLKSNISRLQKSQHYYQKKWFIIN